MLIREDEISDSTEWPEYCYWAAAQVFRLEGKLPEAALALERARAVVQTTAESLDAVDQESFAAISWPVDIAAAAQRGVWPDPPR